MKKHIKLPVTLELLEYEGQSGLQLTFSREALQDWCLGLCLLDKHLIETLIVSDRSGNKKIRTEVLWTAGPADKAQMQVGTDTVGLLITGTQFRHLLDFFLEYYRDGVAAVDHLDLETTATGTKSEDAYVIFKVPDYVPPMTRAEAEERLKDF